MRAWWAGGALGRIGYLAIDIIPVFTMRHDYSPDPCYVFKLKT